MALNTTLATRRRQSGEDLATKVRLERIGVTEINELFDTIAADLASFYAITGTVQNAQSYIPELTGILTRQFNRANRAFSNQLITFIRENPNGEADNLRAQLTILANGRGTTLDVMLLEMEGRARAKFIEFTEPSVQEAVRQITGTNQKMLETSVLKARAALLDELGREPTQQEIAGRASTFARVAGKNRAPSIITTQNQKASEATKEFERNELISVRNSIDSRIQGLPPLKVTILWMTIGDDLVRGSHLEADFQEREGDTFTVQNQLLRFPGDTSLGATVDNVANCRCNAITVIED